MLTTYLIANMDPWYVTITIYFTILLIILSLSLSNSKPKSKPKGKLPPGPYALPILGNLEWLCRNSLFQMKPTLNTLHAKYGPVVTLHKGSRPDIFVNSHSMAHRLLVQDGPTFSGRPKRPATGRVSINSSTYGPTWRLFRRNLKSEVFHPSRFHTYGGFRRRVLDALLELLETRSEAGLVPIQVEPHFQYAMFCLMCFMCFGKELDDDTVLEVEAVVRCFLRTVVRFGLLDDWPRLGKFLFPFRYKEMKQLHRDLERVLLPLIRNTNKGVLSYADTLSGLYLPEEKRPIEEEDIISLCCEFIAGGTDTTTTTLEWTLANLVKYSWVQDRLFEEIKACMADKDRAEVVSEEDAQKMPYLKAVILEVLRLHPPGHFVLPHTVSEDVVLEDGTAVPKEATVNFNVAALGRDPAVWDDPNAFKPERFVSSKPFDVTGVKEIKMMPFGAGRRICPGSGVAIFHLQYFVANLIWRFEWRGVEGEEIDFTEKEELTIIMKNTVRACLFPRVVKST